jgi:hypothetical protein
MHGKVLNSIKQRIEDLEQHSVNAHNELVKNVEERLEKIEEQLPGQFIVYGIKNMAVPGQWFNVDMIHCNQFPPEGIHQGNSEILAITNELLARQYVAQLSQTINSQFHPQRQ